MNLKYSAMAMMSVLILCGACVPEESDESQMSERPETAQDHMTLSKEQAAEQHRDGKADFSLDLCEINDWYEDGSCDWFCLRRDTDCNAEPLFQVTGALPVTRAPVILTHGFNAGKEGMWSFHEVEEALEADGHDVHAAEVPAFDSVPVRAAYLGAFIDEVREATGSSHVHIVAHSMGGLDSRYLISELGYGDRVLTLTTISSPHHGSAVADAALGLIPGFADATIDMLATLWSKTYNEIEGEADVRAALLAISSAQMVEFNAEHEDDARVYYQSWAGVSSALGIANSKDVDACQQQLIAHPGQADRMHISLLAGAAVLAKGLALTPNDGMVTVESATWANFQGCIPADHLDEVGQVRKEGPDPHTGFDHIAFYRTIVSGLAAYE